MWLRRICAPDLRAPFGFFGRYVYRGSEGKDEGGTGGLPSSINWPEPCKS